MHGADAARLELALDPEVEVGRIDADVHIGLEFEHAPAQRAAQRQQARQVAQHLGQAHHGQFLGRPPRLQPRRHHARAADAGAAHAGQARAQRLDQAGAEQVAGRFAGHQHDARGCGIGSGVQGAIQGAGIVRS